MNVSLDQVWVVESVNFILRLRFSISLGSTQRIGKRERVCDDIRIGLVDTVFIYDVVCKNSQSKIFVHTYSRVLIVMIVFSLNPVYKFIFG